MMEAWLTYKDERVRLPITPLYDIPHPMQHSEEYLHELSSIHLIGKRGLREATFDSFFPAQPHDFVDFGDVNFDDPYYYVRKIEEWARTGDPLRLILTETPHNFEVLINAFSAGEPDGSGDVAYTLELKEYVRLKIEEYSIPIKERTVAEWYRWVEQAKIEAGVKTEKELYETKWAKAKALTGEGENYKILDKALAALKAKPEEAKKAAEAYNRKIKLQPVAKPDSSDGMMGSADPALAGGPVSSKGEKMMWPSTSRSQTSSFGPRRRPTKGASKNHKGIDIGAPKGSPAMAAMSGRVVKTQTGFNGGRGNYIIVDHGNGVQTLYQHLSTIEVRVGQAVRQGQRIGGVGNTGVGTGAHLHFEVHRNGVPVNPRNYV